MYFVFGFKNKALSHTIMIVEDYVNDDDCQEQQHRPTTAATIANSIRATLKYAHTCKTT